jgi:inner membrane protein
MKIEITNQAKWHQSITLKLLLLAFLGLILLIPLELIKDVIKERQSNSEKVIKDVSEQWASEQCVSGPVLNIPFRMHPEDDNKKVVMAVWHILPENLDIKSRINPQIRKRGIYNAVIYDSEIGIKGQIIIPQPEGIKSEDILWNQAYLTLGISDNRGLKGKIVLTSDSMKMEAEPGVRDKDLFTSGITFPCPLNENVKKMDLALDMVLAGSLGLQFTPLGKSTLVAVQSGWNSPSFSGNFLPVNRNITDKGFDAQWEVTHLNRNFPQTWTGNLYHPSESAFGVDLYQPVDHYQKSWRSARYGILFIALTFLVLLFIEIKRNEPIHIFHYLLVSLSLILFFSLLNAISEQVGFAIAYLISSIATISLISVFTARILTSKRSIMALSGMLVLLYSFIYILLNLDDFAYLAGNIGLFILLSVVMILSGKMKIFKAESAD